MDLSGIIFVVLALAWAVYLLPKALRQGDEVARSRSVDAPVDASPSSRVLARREAVSARDSRLVVGFRARSTTASPVPGAGPAEASAGASAAGASAVGASALSSRVPTGRTAARVAARRRRRVLGLLLLCTLAVAVASYLGHPPRWAAAVPALLVLGWLVLCRTQVRRASARPVGLVRRPAGRPLPEDDRAQQPLDESCLPAPVMAPAFVEAPADDSEDTVGIAVAGLRGEQPSNSGAGTAAESVWDPLPVTLPTYVTAPKARRTVRTIDLGEPGTWTSGRTVEDAEIAARASATEECGNASEETGSRAVGS